MAGRSLGQPAPLLEVDFFTSPGSDWTIVRSAEPVCPLFSNAPAFFLGKRVSRVVLGPDLFFRCSSRAIRFGAYALGGGCG